MADVAPVPFINFGLSQAQQAQAGASANMQNQQAALVGQQAQQSAMETALMARAMPLYKQTIDNMSQDMSGTPAANAAAPTMYTQAAADGSGAGMVPGSPQSGPTPQQATNASGSAGGGTPAYLDPGAVADAARQANYVQPFTGGEQQALYQGAMMASLPGPAANPGFLRIAQMQNQFRVANQSKMNQYRSGQLYDALTAVQDPGNTDPMGTLRAVPGQRGVASQIAADYPNDPKGQAAAARLYAQMMAYNLHQYTGRGQTLQNGVLVDTTVGAPVTGQDQVLTGLTPEQKAKAFQFSNDPIKVQLTNGQTQPMPRWKAPVAQGGFGGVSPEAYVARENALALRHMNDPTQPAPGASTWDAPTAVGNTTGAAAAKTGNAPAPTVPASPLPAGVRAASGPALAPARAAGAVQAAADQVPSPTTALRGPVPPTGSPAYNARLSAALSDPTYKARWNIPTTVGIPQAGAAAGIAQYQTQRNELMKDSSEMSTSADQALQNFRAAQMIFDSANTMAPLTGPVGALEQKVAATLGLDWRAAATRQEVAKYLVNGAVAGLKQTYGARPGVFDVKINVEKAFPNIESMSPPAIRNLLQSQIMQAQYLKDSAVRAQVYANKGLEPNSFGTWNSTYFPRSELFDSTYGPKTAARPGPAVGAVEQGYRFMGGDPSKPTSWQRVQ